MQREELEFTLSHNKYLKGGTKEACIMAREVLSHRINPGNQLHAPGSCVNIEEFVEAVEVLIAFAFRKEDEVPERWHCDNDCKMASSFLCPGECNIQKNNTKRCPFFMDESDI